MWDGEKRRRTDMPNRFEPQNAFEGYVAAKLENIEKKFDGLPCKVQDERIRNVEQKVSNIQGKATILGAVGGFVMAIINKYLLGK